MIARDPWNTMRGMVEEMDRWTRTGLARRGQELADALGHLPLDVFETQEAYILAAEAPGVAMDAIDVDVEENVVTIRCEKPAPEDTEDTKYHRIERPYGSFQRSVALPSNVNPEDVSATFNAGVLEVKIGKRAESRPRKIDISSPE